MNTMTTKEFVRQVGTAAADRRQAEQKIILSDDAVREALKEWLKGRVIRDIAESLSITPAYLGDIRDGRRTISENVLNKFTGATGV